MYGVGCVVENVKSHTVNDVFAVWSQINQNYEHVN